MIRHCTPALLAVAIANVAIAQAPTEKQSTQNTATARQELERKFAETMSGAALVGHFTTTGKEDGVPKQERYTLGKVSKLNGDLWRFETRIQYGDHDLKVPLAINVFWAGDTPVISLTKLAIPGLGTFTARVLIYDDQYAGTWNAGDHGGHLFGTLERAKDKTDGANSGAKADSKNR